MAADLTTISRTIADALRVLDTGDRGLVVRGWRTEPYRMPLVTLSAPVVGSEQGPVLGQYLRSVRYDVQAWRRVADPNSDALVEQAEELSHELHSALESARITTTSPLYTLPEFAVETTISASDEESREARRVRGPGGDVVVPAGCVLVLASIALQYRRRTGLARADT